MTISTQTSTNYHTVSTLERQHNTWAWRVAPSEWTDKLYSISNKFLYDSTFSHSVCAVQNAAGLGASVSYKITFLSHFIALEVKSVKCMWNSAAMKCLQLLGLILLALHCTDAALQELFRWKQIGYRDLPSAAGSKLDNYTFMQLFCCDTFHRGGGDNVWGRNNKSHNFTIPSFAHRFGLCLPNGS